MDCSILRTTNSMRRPDAMKWTPAPPLEVVVWGLAALGILFRLRQYLFDRSLWLDEALVVLNIMHRSPSELLKPLDYHQGAPLGFLALEKAAVLGFGTSEAVLRLVPFLSGVLSMILFVIVSRRFLAPAASMIAVGLFAVSDPLIYYSTEAKQYSSDVAVAILRARRCGRTCRHCVHHWGDCALVFAASGFCFGSSGSELAPGFNTQA